MPIGDLKTPRATDARSTHILGGYASRLIKFKARQLSRRPGFSVSDLGDIEQELYLDVLQRLPKYDPDRAQLNTFIARIVDRKIASLLRYHMAAKRCCNREECSLNDPVLDGDGRPVQRHQTTPEATNSSHRLRDLEHDIGDVLTDVPTIQRTVATKLANGTINSISSDLGISRRTVMRHIKELRQQFEDAGLRDYL